MQPKRRSGRCVARQLKASAEILDALADVTQAIEAAGLRSGSGTAVSVSAVAIVVIVVVISTS